MSNWISITVDTLNEARVAALVRACSTAAKAEGQADRAPGLIQAVVDEIRRKVASCGSNRVDADNTTIPKGLRLMATDMIIAELKKAIMRPLTKDEEKALEKHELNLNRIADCKDTVDQPDDPTEPEVEQVSGGAWGSKPKIGMRTEGS